MRQVKARYWVAVLYPENMINDWELKIGDILEFPYCYCIHDKDHTSKDDEDRKTHIHCILCFNNTTTYKKALSMFNKLSKDGCQCVNTIQDVANIRNMYNYLIHDTETCKKQDKYLYSPSDRVCGNNFDIGCFEQISNDEKKQIRYEIEEIIRDKGFMNYNDLYYYVSDNCDSLYKEVFTSFSGHFERLTKGNYQKHIEKCKALKENH